MSLSVIRTYLRRRTVHKITFFFLRASSKYTRDDFLALIAICASQLFIRRHKIMAFITFFFCKIKRDVYSFPYTIMELMFLGRGEALLHG